ncbi:MAG: tetratricopeptide repeat protein [Ferruginibacter sp.]|nr:tetratricopeptide repeat protein [Ferruginibacter sp.]
MMKKVQILTILFFWITGGFAQPKTADENYVEAMRLVKQGKIPESVPFFNAAIKLNPKHGDAYLQAGIVLTMLNKPTDALICLKQAQKLKKNNATVFNSLGVLYKNGFGKPDSALYFFKKLVPLKADTTVEACYNIGWGYNASQQYDSAIKYLKKSLDINNDFKTGYKEISYSFYKGNKMKEGLEYFKSRLAISVVDVNLYYIGLINSELGNKEEAMKYHEQLKAINERSAASLLKRIEGKKG